MTLGVVAWLMRMQHLHVSPHRLFDVLGRYYYNNTAHACLPVRVYKLFQAVGMAQHVSHHAY